MNEQQQAYWFAYRTDPTFHAIISAMVQMAVPEDRGQLHHEAALHFFVFGTMMLLHPTLAERSLTRPWDWGIKPDGTAEYLGKIRGDYEGPRPIVIPPESYLLLTLDKPLPLPTHADGEVVGAEPWIKAWSTAMTDLDAFLDASQ
jgi:hypothetical protein